MGNSLPIQPMPEFSPDADIGASLASRWKTWLTELEMFPTASGITDTKRKRALLLYQAGATIREIFDQLADTEEDKNYETAKKKLSACMRFIVFVRLRKKERKHFINFIHDCEHFPKIANSRNWPLK